MVTLLEDSLCKLSALHVEVLLRWRDGVAPSLESPSSMQPRLLKQALEQDIDSKRPVIAISGSCSALLGPATPTNGVNKAPHAWETAVLNLNLARLTEVLGFNTRQLEHLASMGAAILPSDGALPSFLFDYESPSGQV